MTPADMELIPRAGIVACIVLTLSFGICCLCASMIMKPSVSAGAHLGSTYSDMMTDTVAPPKVGKATPHR